MIIISRGMIEGLFPSIDKNVTMQYTKGLWRSEKLNVRGLFFVLAGVRRQTSKLVLSYSPLIIVLNVLVCYLYAS